MSFEGVIPQRGQYRVVKWTDDGSEVVGDFDDYAVACAEADRLASETVRASVFGATGRRIYAGGQGAVAIGRPISVTRLAGLTEPKSNWKYRRRK